LRYDRAEAFAVESDMVLGIVYHTEQEMTYKAVKPENPIKTILSFTFSFYSFVPALSGVQ